MKPLLYVAAGLIPLMGCSRKQATEATTRSTRSTDTRQAEKLRFALGLDTLPESVRHIEFGEDSWTDFRLAAYCEVDPNDFSRLLTGRDFVEKTQDPFLDEIRPVEIAPPDFAPSIPVFTASIFYSWNDGNMNCELVASEARDRIFVIYSAD